VIGETVKERRIVPLIPICIIVNVVAAAHDWPTAWNPALKQRRGEVCGCNR